MMRRTATSGTDHVTGHAEGRPPRKVTAPRLNLRAYYWLYGP